jgi:hypothetical protein
MNPRGTGPLTALSAGLDQMESAPVVAAGAAVSVKPAVDKSRLDELGKQSGMEVKGSEPAEGASLCIRHRARSARTDRWPRRPSDESPRACPTSSWRPLRPPSSCTTR